MRISGVLISRQSITYITEVTRRTLMPTIYLNCSTQYGKVMTVLCSEITERALPTISVF